MTPTTNSVEPTTSATDELRRLLDERGVEWMPIAWNPKRETFYHTSNGVGFCADEYADGVKIYTDATITPEQAVAATLGRGECHMTKMRLPYDDDGSYWLLCDQCGFMLYMRDCWQPVRFCSHCGAKVVSE